MALWEELSVQPAAAGQLKRAAARPSDSYLFTGPDGVGKSHAARVFAAAMLCEEACGQCNICRRVVQGLHPDVGIYGADGHTFAVETIREMVNSATQTPMEAKRRVFIVEDADRITERSQNTLLKALEEPNASVTWILIAGKTQTLLPTIVSRLKLIVFKTVGEQEILKIAETRWGAGDAMALIKAARGDLRIAKQLVQSESARQLRLLAGKAAGEVVEIADAAEIQKELSALCDVIVEQTAAGQREEIAGLQDTFGGGRGFAGMKKRVSDRHKRRLRRVQTEVYSDFLYWLATALRDIAAARLAPHGRSVADLLVLIQMCLDAQVAIAENANPELAVESVLFGLCLQRVV